MRKIKSDTKQSLRRHSLNWSKYPDIVVLEFKGVRGSTKVRYLNHSVNSGENKYVPISATYYPIPLVTLRKELASRLKDWDVCTGDVRFYIGKWEQQNRQKVSNRAWKAYRRRSFPRWLVRRILEERFELSRS